MASRSMVRIGAGSGMGIPEMFLLLTLYDTWPRGIFQGAGAVVLPTPVGVNRRLGTAPPVGRCRGRHPRRRHLSFSRLPVFLAEKHRPETSGDADHVQSRPGPARGPRL